MATNDGEALMTGLIGLVFLAVFAVSTAKHGSWRTSWRGPALIGVALCVAATVAELRGVVFVGPGGGHGHGISVF